jgi:hypothetical protein
MSFKDIIAVQAAYTARDVVKGKGKRGRKHKSVLLDEGKPESDPEPNPELELEPESDPEPGLEKEPEPEMVRTAKKVRKSTGRRAPKRTSIVEADLPEPTPEAEPVLDLELTRDIPLETWSVPVVQIY